MTILVNAKKNSLLISSSIVPTLGLVRNFATQNIPCMREEIRDVSQSFNIFSRNLTCPKCHFASSKQTLLHWYQNNIALYKVQYIDVLTNLIAVLSNIAA
jgi:hypothetical protein